MPGHPVVPTPEAWEELRRELRQLKLDLSNTRRRLATFGVRRHEGGFIPPRGNFRLCKFNATLSQGSTAEATEIIWNGTAFEDGDTFTVTDFFFNEGESAAADTKAIAFAVGDIWVPIPYCAVSDTLPE